MYMSLCIFDRISDQPQAFFLSFFNPSSMGEQQFSVFFYGSSWIRRSTNDKPTRTNELAAVWFMVAWLVSLLGLGSWLGAPVRFPARDGSLLPPVHTVSFAVQVVRRGRSWLPGGFCLYETGGSAIKKHRQEQNKC
ncbi:hypothetical protein PVAP13_5NG257662 [Panicum virgatum]|uniref:Uncharacterized protein n=1 Tax=Panicum virgatum TaxID=38727 RepID=A0A8T0RWU4_PANVG|nr:hypothetical protein PVAP13_5NG257662 [Panicum virgatum]